MCLEKSKYIAVSCFVSERNFQGTLSAIELCRETALLAVLVPFLKPEARTEVAVDILEELARLVVLAHQFLATEIVHIVTCNPIDREKSCLCFCPTKALALLTALRKT